MYVEIFTKILLNFNLDILYYFKHKKIKINLRIVVYLIKLFINHWCTEVNRILTGKRQMRCGDSDPIMKLANI